MQKILFFCGRAIAALAAGEEITALPQAHSWICGEQEPREEGREEERGECRDGGSPPR